jgi:TolB-like protein/Tfp pilus assembly protein PilF
MRGPGGAVQLANKKLCGLLGYLVCAGPAPQTRERLMSLFWGSHFDAQARQNLRQALTRLRRVLGDDIFVRSDESVALRPGAVASDVERFEVLVEDGSQPALAAAVDLYGGEFLADVTIKEEAWVEWLTAQRARLEDMALGAMIRLSGQELEQGRAEPALAAAHRAVAIDRMREDAHRLIMRALAASGRRAEALKHHDQLSALLKRELSIEPDAATKALVAELRRPERVADAAVAPEPSAEPASDRPSIAVLPFENLSGDPGQEYFADGMAEEVITALSRCRSLFVIARNSSFVYKGKPVDVRQVGRELGVRYVIEGSVRRGGDKLRITGQLIDTASGNHIWADRFEGETSDVFALQDRFAESVAAIIEPRLRLAEMQRLKQKPTGNHNAYDLLLRAQQSIYEWTAESLEAAIRSLEQALALDPNYALASATLASCYTTRWSEGWTKDRRAESAEGLRLVARALEFGTDDSEVLWRAALATLQLAMDAPRAAELVYRALDVNPNSSIALAIAGWIETLSGHHDKALELFDRAQRLSPRDPRAWTIESGISHARYQRGEFAESLALARKALNGNPRLSSSLVMQVASLGMLGEKERAAVAMADAVKLVPHLTISTLRARTMFSKEHVWQKIADGLRLAGMPE